jgi:hypothetical protein
MSMERSAPSPALFLLGLVILSVAAVGALEAASDAALARAAAPDGAPTAAPIARVLNAYLRAKYHVLGHLVVYSILVLFGPPAIYTLLRKSAAAMSAWRARVAGMVLRTPSYAFAQPFADQGGALNRLMLRDRGDVVACTQAAFCSTLFGDEMPAGASLLGFDDRGEPVYISDAARAMHVHLLGQTGSGKTASVIYPLLFQDARRGFPIVFIDGKGSVDNEEQLAAIAAATGRLHHTYIFSLNPGRPCHTYNPLHLTPGADPQQVAERVFSTFESDLDVQYYKDMARELFVHLVRALASSGKAMTMRDVYAAIKDRDVLEHGLSLCSDRHAVRAIQSTYAQLGKKVRETYTGLLAALNRYDHPAINVYDPDIVLEDLIETGGVVGFSLSANAYKFQARAIGLILLQHLQQIGAQRQMDRSKSQRPARVYADEFYTFAYDGFIDFVNKLRDAHMSILLAHQDLSDLDRISPEFARGIWGNTRNKIVLYQSDVELCERMAQASGTTKGVELTVQRTIDGFLNNNITGMASSREVDEFVLHPNNIRSLLRGQAYLLQAGLGTEAQVAGKTGPGRRFPWSSRRSAPAATRVSPVNLSLLPPLPPACLAEPRQTSTADGIGLYELFLQTESRDAEDDL